MKEIRVSRVSVIIPAYDRAGVVGDAIDSVLAQTYRDFELIVVDDASTDNTSDVLARYAEPVQVIRRTANSGAGAARNDGIRASTGEFIAFLDSDDLYLPKRLQSAVDLLDSHREYGAAYAEAALMVPGRGLVEHWVAARGGGRSGWILDGVLERDLIRTQTITVRRSVLDRVGLFDEQLRSGQDDDLFWRIARETQIGYVDEIGAVLRIHPDGLSRSGSRASESWIRRTRKALNNGVWATARQRRILQRRLYEELRAHAFYLGKEGRAWEVRTACLSAARVALVGGSPVRAFKSVAAALYGQTGQKCITRLRQHRRRGALAAQNGPDAREVVAQQEGGSQCPASR
jgi:glycosyltransferase involved in cell wall biosynthesis